MKFKYYLLFLLLIDLHALKSMAQAPFPVGYTDLYTAGTFSKTIDLSKTIGTIEGAAGTSPSGAATYTIPVKCPPGTNGMVPDLSLVYSSQGGNGILGQGWNLSGLSVITRSGKNIYHDGQATPVTYSNNDAFLVDGARIFTISGSNGANGTTYRTEAETYALITSYGSINGGPQYFHVISKDSTVMEYGYTTDARVMDDAGANVMMWRLNKIQDINGNYIRFIYDNSGNESRVSRIEYTGNVRTGLLPYNFIDFGYGSRDDKNRIYDGGSTINTSDLLSGIQVGEIATGERTVGLLMHYGTGNHKSYLKELIEYDGDDKTLNDTRFKYGNETNDFSAATSNISIPYHYPLESGVPEIVSGDFDGDGKSEVLVAHYDFADVDYYDQIFNRNYTDFALYKQSASGSTTDTYTPLSGGSASWTEAGKHLVSFKQTNASKNFVVSDFDGDGKDDLFFFRSTAIPSSYPVTYKMDGTTIYYSRSGSSGFYFDKADYNPVTLSPAGTIHMLNGQNKVLLGDFDGDKRTDFLYLTRSLQYSGGVAHYTDHSFVSFPGKGAMDNRLMLTGTPTTYDETRTNDLMTNDVYVLDFDGDGKSEIMIVGHLTSYIYKISKSSSGYYFLEYITEQGYPTKDYHDIYGLGDFNGDGKDDIVTRVRTSNYWEIGYATGTLFKGYQFEFNAGYPFQEKCGDYQADRIFIGDYDGDGKSDLLQEHCDCSHFRTQSTYNAYYFKGIGADNKMRYAMASYNYAKKADLNSVTASRPILTDVNGDGKHELSFKESYDNNMQTIYLNKDSKSHLLESVTDGFNRTTTFTYDQLSKSTGTGSDFYTKGAGETYPVNNGQYPMYVVTAMTQPDGIGASTSTTFKYENLRLHRSGRGLLGFQKIIAANAVSNTRAESIYELNRDFYTSYLKSSKAFLLSSGMQLSQADNTVIFTAIGSNCFKQENTVTTSQDLLKGITASSVTTYDNYGNVVQSVANINSGLETVTTNTTYIAPPSSAIPVLPTSVTVTRQRSGQPAVAKTTAITYTGRKPNKITEYSGTSTALSKALTYDLYGNVISEQTQQAMVSASDWPKTEYTYDTKGRFQIAKKNPLGQMSYTSYHKFFGQPISETGISGNEITYEYNTWGKLLQTNMPGPYSITYADGWDVSGLKLYYTMTQHPGAPDVKTWYDAMGRALEVKTEAYAGAWTTANTSYNARGNTATTTQPRLPAEPAEVTTNTYDDYDRLIATTDVSGTTSYNYSYSGGNTTIQVTKPSGQSVSRTTDATGATVSSTDNGGKMLFTYDSWGNQLTARHDARSGPMILNKYDSYGRKTSTTDIDAGTTSYTYDNMQRLKVQTDAKGNSYEFKYDLAGRITQRIPNGGYEPSVYTYYGAAYGNQIQSVTIGLTTTSYKYNTLGQVTEEKLTTPGRTMYRNYNYDLYGRNTTIAYSSGFNLLRTYDANGYLQIVRTNNPGVTPTVLFNALSMNGKGQYTAYNECNGAVSSINYQYGMPIHYTTTGIQDLEMSYDFSNGNLMERRDNVAGYAEHFSYDNLDRLTNSQVDKLTFPPVAYMPQTQTYDVAGSAPVKSLGNIKTKSDAGQYYYSPISKVHGVLRIDPPLDAISHSTQDIAYTVFNKTATITENGYQQSYGYDGNDERYYGQLTLGGAIKRRRWYFGDMETDQVLPGGTERQLHYIAGGNGLCAVVVAEGGSFQSYAAYTDHLGSIVKLTDVSGAVVAVQNYDAWGRERNALSWDHALSLGTKPEWLYRGYTGHEMLPEFDLVNMNGRMYDPINGRMLRPDNYVQDPFSTQSYNRYSYCWNNPLKFTDPSGDIIWAPIIIGAVVGAYMGGSMANDGNLNPTQWNYSSGKTWGWMAGGAIVGGISGGIGGEIAASGIPFANTLGIAASSLANSIGTAIYTGGKTNLNMSLGVASFDFSTGELGYLGKEGNSVLANIGYGFGALANIQDGFAGIRGVNAEYRSESDGITHARLRGEYNKSKFDISVAHENVSASSYKYPLVPDDPGYNGLLENLDYARYWSTNIKKGLYYGDSGNGLSLNISNVNGKWLQTMSNRLGDGINQGNGLWGIGKLKYGTTLFGCQSHVAHALLGVGIPTLPINFMPQILYGQLLLRQAGIYASPLLINR